MKIKLLVSRSGPIVSNSVGDVIDVDASEGQRMIDAGQAEIVRSVKKQTAVKKPTAEKAAKQ